jgi:hypothetical protein
LYRYIAALQSYHDAGVVPLPGGGGGAGGGGSGGGGGGQQSLSSSPSKPPKSQAAAALASTDLLSPRKIGRRVRPVSISKAFK